MKLYFAIIMLLAPVMMLFAVPAKPGVTRLLTLTDGTTVSATLVGDEHGHFWRDADGRNYLLVSGTDTYQEVNAQEIIQKAQQRRSQANQRRMKRLASHRIGTVGNISGQKKGLIILVNFTDVTFQSGNNKDLFLRIANEQNFKYKVSDNHSFNGSIYDYFKAQSDGQFELTFDIVGPVTVSNTQAYYGGNNDKGSDLRPGEMVKEAVQLVDSEVNFADYDWNDDKEVDQVYVIYAGNGEADSHIENSIWPHEWDLKSATGSDLTLDGVKVNTYACGAELNGNNLISGIGTMCHEFSHCLGYPDFYDTDYSGGQGMFLWDLMSSGSYCSGGYCPAGYTSYERWMAGWKIPTELVNTQTVSNMKALQDVGSQTYIIYNKGNNNEYFLLENRQKTGWDAGLPGAGLLIVHVDYDAEVWSKNKPNDDPDHQRMTWIPADNEYQSVISEGTKRYSISGAANDPFPYGSVNAFNRNTTPAAKLYNKNSDNTYYLDASVENITQNSDGTISFDFIEKVLTKLVFIDNVDNGTAISSAAAAGEAYDVTLQDRTLYKDGMWNTLCLPFNVTIAESPLADASVMKLTASTSSLNNGVLTLNFENVTTTMTAGTPYIVKWNKANDYDTADPDMRDLKSPTFNSVTITATPDNTVFDGGSFVGVYAPHSWTTENKSILLLGANNQLFWPKPDGANTPYINACRAYFQLDGGSEARELVLNFSDDATGIASHLLPLASHLLPLAPCPSEWYTLDGRKLSGKPTAKGVYIVRGAKIVIK